MERKLNSAFRFLAIILCLAGFSVAAMAQKKTTKRTTTAKKTAVVVPINNATEVRNGADKVSIQIKNVSRFVYLLGGFAKAIEDLDREAKTRKISQASVDANNKNKQAVIQGIQNIRAGLISLETEFRAKPALRMYAVRVDGISSMVAEAEVQANSGQITESGRTLLMVIERLSDALAALP
jgi:hypothetical protein